MKEHKKLYKAGKLWLTAMISIVAGGVLLTSNANADTTTPTTQSVQANSQQTANQPNVVANTQEDHASSYGQVDYSSNYGNLDSVKLNSVSGDTAHLQVSGWHAAGASEVQPYHYLLVYDNTNHNEVARLHRGSVHEVNRYDVQNVYPNVYNSYRSGYRANVQLPSNVLAHSLSLVSRYSDYPYSGEGNHTDYWSNMNIDMGNHANLDGVHVYGNHVQVTGWNATNQAALGNGRNYHYIIAFDQSTGQEIRRKRVNTSARKNYRPDVANVYSGVYKASHSGFNVDFDLNNALINDEIQFVSRWSSDPAGNYDSVDYWFGGQHLFADRGNYGSLDSFVDRNGNMQISGWHASNQALGKDYHYIIVFDQTTGREVNRTRVYSGTSRNDVARVYPQVFNASNSGFDVSLPYSSALNGHRLQVVSRWTDDPAGNGYNTTDYWFGPQVLVNVAPSNNLANGIGHLDGWRIYSDNGEYNIDVIGWHALNNIDYNRDEHQFILYDNTTNQEVGLPVDYEGPGDLTFIRQYYKQNYKITKRDYRPDVSAIYGSKYANAAYSGFKLYIPVSAPYLTFGHDYSIISRYNDIQSRSTKRDLVFHIGPITRDLVYYGDYRDFIR